MTINNETPDAFTQLGAIFRAWESTTKEIVAAYIKAEILLMPSDENDTEKEKEKKIKDKKFLSHKSRLEDSETMAAFGYVARAEDKTNFNAIMQADIVKALAPDCAQERQKVRQDIKRRMDALEFFGLIKRKYLTDTALQLSATDIGKEFRTSFNQYFEEENSKLKGSLTCLAA